MLIFVITGKKRAGKDTVGNIIEAYYGGAKIALADHLRLFTKRMLDICYDDDVALAPFSAAEKDTTMVHGKTHRRWLQLVGTELVRTSLGGDIWAKYAYKSINKCETDVLIITDCRFQDELEFFMNTEHTVISLRVDRPIDIKSDTHSSETGTFPVKHTIKNDGTIDDLTKKIHELLKLYGGGSI